MTQIAYDSNIRATESFSQKMTSATTARQPYSFAWLCFGFMSAIASVVIIVVTINPTGTAGIYYKSIEGILAMMLSSLWCFAAFYGVAKGFGKA